MNAAIEQVSSYFKPGLGLLVLGVVWLGDGYAVESINVRSGSKPSECSSICSTYCGSASVTVPQGGAAERIHSFQKA